MADDDDSYRSLGQTVSDTRDQVAKGKSDRKSSAGSAIAGGLGRMADTQKEAADRASSNIHAVQYRKGGKIRKRKRSGKRMKARR